MLKISETAAINSILYLLSYIPTCSTMCIYSVAQAWTDTEGSRRLMLPDFIIGI